MVSFNDRSFSETFQVQQWVIFQRLAYLPCFSAGLSGIHTGYQVNDRFKAEWSQDPAGSPSDEQGIIDKTFGSSKDLTSKVTWHTC